MTRLKRIWRENGLTLFFTAIFLAALIGQSVFGWMDANERLVTGGLEPQSYLDYLRSADFGVDISENWQSEYLQFLLYIWATVWLVQRGSPESKQLDEVGRSTDEEMRIGPYATADSPRWAKLGGWRTFVLSNSLVMVMGLIFLLSWLAQSVAGWSAFNSEQIRDLSAPLPWREYIRSPDFWNRTLQNWQSEFLAVGSMVVLSVFLRQRGSPESKPVGAPHDDATGETG